MSEPLATGLEQPSNRLPEGARHDTKRAHRACRFPSHAGGA
jgi:hypothetical protein